MNFTKSILNLAKFTTFIDELQTNPVNWLGMILIIDCGQKASFTVYVSALY